MAALQSDTDTLLLLREAAAGGPAPLPLRGVRSGSGEPRGLAGGCDHQGLQCLQTGRSAVWLADGEMGASMMDQPDDPVPNGLIDQVFYIVGADRGGDPENPLGRARPIERKSAQAAKSSDV